MDGIASFLAGTSDASHSAPRRLSQDPGDWAAEVIRLVSSMVPPDVPAQPQVHFNQIDETNGYAVGSVHLADGNGAIKGFIPVIVNRFQLKPMDILVSGGKFSPLTERRLRELFVSTAMDDGVIDLWKVRDGSDNDISETNPSSAGLYPYAGATMSRDDFLQTLSEDDQADLRAGLSASPAGLGILNAMGKQSSVHELMTPTRPAVELEPAVTVRTFEKVAAGKYRILTSDEGNFGPKMVETDEDGLRVVIKEAIPEQRDDWLTRVHTQDSATLKAQEENSEENLADEKNINQGPRGGEVFLYRTDRTTPEDGTEHCGCFAMTTSGQRIRGVLVPKVVDLDGKSINTKLFLGRRIAGVQPKIAIERISGTVDFKEAVEDAVPSRDETGTLVHVDEKGDAVALVPMTIDSIWTDHAQCPSSPGEEDEPRGPRMTISARTMLGKKVELVVGQCKGIVDITPQYRLTESKAPTRRRYAVSSEFNWVPMPEFKEFMDQPRLMRDAEDIEKKASIPDLRVIHTGLGYCFQAPWVAAAQVLMEKEASFDLSCLSAPEARHLLCEWGLNVPTADGVIKVAKALGSLRVRGIENPIEKWAASPFMAVPSKLKMLRAALMGLGLGGAGLAAGGAASANAAYNEVLPEATQRWAESEDMRQRYGDRLQAVANQESRIGDTRENAQAAFNRADRGNWLQRGRHLATGAGEAAKGRVQQLHAGHLQRRADAYKEPYDSSMEGRRRPAGDFTFFEGPAPSWMTTHGLSKQQSANPAVEMLAFLRKQAKAVFPALVYASRAHYGREKLAQAGETIETAMDLNFLNPQNVSYFIGLTPKLEDVLDGLGRLLIAVRIGLPDIDEEVVRSAVKQLDSILSGLRALSFAETDE